VIDGQPIGRQIEQGTPYRVSPGLGVHEKEQSECRARTL
jgi:hypothetical protein